MLKKIALLGNPNSGKTSFFNYVTGGNEYVGNRCGVTVSAVKRKIKNTDFLLCDLPGVYSLSPISEDELVTAEFIKNEKLHAILNIIDANNLERSLYLTIELILSGCPVIAVINMADELKKRGVSIDLLKLESFLGIKIFKISSKSGEGVKELLSHLSIPKKPLPLIKEKYIKSFSSFKTEEDDIKKALAIYKLSEEATKLSLTLPEKQKELTSHLDKIFLNKYFAIPILTFILTFIFFTVFGPPGEALKTLILKAFDFLIATPLNTLVKGSAVSLLLYAVLNSLKTVLSFMGQLFTLFFLISLLEETGYMARASFTADRLFKKMGLSGNSFIPLVLGLGCTTTAVMAGRTIINKKEKRILTLITPFIPCSAKLPVYFYFATLFFPETKGWIILFIYLLSVFTAVILGKLLSGGTSHSDSSYMLELPPYRMPDFSKCILDSLKKVWEFFIRFGTTIFLMSALIWLLHNLDFSLKPAVNESKSILSSLGKMISPLFKPLGFGMWQFSVSLLFGIIAKESVLAVLTVLFKGGELFNILGKAGAISFLCFFTLYPPCFSAMSVMAKELKDKKWVLLSLILHFIIAYSFSFIIYTIAKAL